MSLLIAGVDKVPKLFETDPSGALLEYKATAIGSGRQEVMEYFESEYREDLSLDDAIVMGLVAMGKAINSEISSDGIEVGVVRVEDKKFKLLDSETLKPYIEKANEKLREELSK